MRARGGAEPLADRGNQLADVGRQQLERVVLSPTGAPLSLLQREDAPFSSDALHWTELSSTDVEQDLAWMCAAFGLGVDEVPLPDGAYHVLTADGEGIGGCTRSILAGLPSCFVAWERVDDIEASAGSVQRSGGELLGGVVTMDGVGKWVVCQDSTGSLFGIIEPVER